MTISPYELLCACKPKKPAALVTPYDLYSQSQQAIPPEPHPAPPASVPSQPASPPVMPPSAAHTHYIADIQKRHSAATRRTAFTTSPIP